MVTVWGLASSEACWVWASSALALVGPESEADLSDSFSLFSRGGKFLKKPPLKSVNLVLYRELSFPYRDLRAALNSIEKPRFSIEKKKLLYRETSLLYREKKKISIENVVFSIEEALDFFVLYREILRNSSIGKAANLYREKLVFHFSIQTIFIVLIYKVNVSFLFHFAFLQNLFRHLHRASPRGDRSTSGW